MTSVAVSIQLVTILVLTLLKTQSIKSEIRHRATKMFNHRSNGQSGRLYIIQAGIACAVLRLFLFLKESGVLTKTYFVLFLRVNQEEESTLLLSLPKVSAVLLEMAKEIEEKTGIESELLFLVMFKEAAVRQFVTELWLKVKWVVKAVELLLEGKQNRIVCNATT